MGTARHATAAEPRWCTGWRRHGPTSNWRSERPAGLSDYKSIGLGIEKCAVKVFGSIILIVIVIGVTTCRLRLRVIEILLVERSNTVGTLLWVVVGIIRRERAKAHRQSVHGAAEFINSEASRVLGVGLRAQRFRSQRTLIGQYTFMARR
jgi:hypothetical protein